MLPKTAPGGERTRPILVVVTMMGGVGPTGVETHFKQILRSASELGYSTKLVTPYTGPRWVRALFRPLKNRREESAQVLYRTAQARVIQSQLAKIRRESSQPVVIYAQCPLTARSALRTGTPDANWRVFLVIHYNQSEVAEILEKRIARPGGPWCRQLERVERSVLPRVGKIIFVSDYMRRLVNARLPEIANVPQETQLNFPPPPMIPAAARHSGDLIAIGTLEPRKNQGFLLEVLAQARARGEKYSLAIVGDGPDRVKLEQRSRELGLDAQVRFLGFRADAARLIPEYRVLAHAARLENCPITLIEGLSYGKPLLAPAVGGIPEIFRDGQEGFFWDLQDPGAAADRLIVLLGNAQNYAKMATASRQRYAEFFAPLPERWVAMLVAQQGIAPIPRAVSNP